MIVKSDNKRVTTFWFPSHHPLPFFVVLSGTFKNWKWHNGNIGDPDARSVESEITLFRALLWLTKLAAL